MSENEEKPATGPVATDGSDGPAVAAGSADADAPLPTDGAPAEQDPAAAVEDRTTPSNGETSNGTAPAASSAEPAEVSTPSTNGVPKVEPAAAESPGEDSTAVFARPTPLPRPRPEDPDPVAEAEATETALPGSVPTPPPWRRATGEDVTERVIPRPAPRTAPVDSLLSEAPTAYIDGAKAGTTTGSASFLGTQTEVHAEVPTVGGRAPRQALLQVKRFDPWSVLKLALVLAVVLFFIWLVAVGVLYGVLDGMGVWDRLNGTYADLVSGGGQGGGGSLISAGSVFGIAAIVGAINSVLFAVAMTVGAFVYNVSADLVGGVEVTLSERD